jgi:hypothetical protein
MKVTCYKNDCINNKDLLCSCDNIGIIQANKDNTICMNFKEKAKEIEKIIFKGYGPGVEYLGNKINELIDAVNEMRRESD